MSSAERQATAEHAAAPASDYDAAAYEHHTNVLGMWVFLATELLLFGGLFTVYATYRYTYPEAFREGSTHLHATLGAVNTGILILSSLMVALAIHSAQVGGRRSVAGFLALTLLLGTAFLVIKGIEYADHIQAGLGPGRSFTYAGELQPQVRLFFSLYYSLTGLHALHMLLGLGLIALMAVFAWRGRYTHGHYTPLELTGLYWHFVDVVWVFIFPLLYLIGRG